MANNASPHHAVAPQAPLSEHHNLIFAKCASAVVRRVRRLCPLLIKSPGEIVQISVSADPGLDTSFVSEATVFSGRLSF